MIPFAGRAILLDVEGTTSSIAYVTETLFPYARGELRAFLNERWDSAEVVRARDLIAQDAGAANFAQWCAGRSVAAEIDLVCAEVNRLMDGDIKATGLKELQGLIWREGYRAGLLQSHVFPDVPPALAAWTKLGMDVRIFSSGSIAAQRVFFAHTGFGDLTPFFRGHYDTTVGPKRVATSYLKIAADMQLPTAEILFVSDITLELDAARAAGMATALAVRPGNATPSVEHGHAVIGEFSEIAFAKRRSTD